MFAAMKHVLWVWAALAIACGASPSHPASHPEVSPPSSSVARRIERIEHGLLPAVQVKGEEVRSDLEAQMREHKIPALSIAVFENYQLQWTKAYGLADVETGQRATEETIFLAGSISKSVNSLAILLAVADGTLALDRPINELLESWKLPDNELTRAAPVTLRKLLSHSAGTTVHGFPGYAAGVALPTVPQILDGKPPANTDPIRVDLAPGTKYRYSGGGTVISQLALTERSKRPYQAILAERVLGPLEMVHSTFEQALPPDRVQHAAAGYDGTGHVIPGKRHAYPEMAAAGLWTTPSDLARFFLEVARARAHKPSRVPGAIAMQMTTKVIDGDGGDEVGLGVFLSDRNGARFFGHGGADEGFQADVVCSLDGGYGIVVMANSDNGFQIFEDIERAVFTEYGWPGVDPQIVRIALEPAQRARFIGQFLDGPAPVAIAEQSGQLVLRTPFGPSVELVPIAPDRVVQRNSGRQLHLGATGSLGATSPHREARTLTRIADPARHPLFELEAGRFDGAVTAWRERTRLDPKSAGDDENFANNLGYQLLEREPAKAIDVLRLVAAVFPESSNAHDSLGEAYMKAGDKPHAIAEYEQALRTLDADPRVPEAIKKTRRTHAEEQLAKLRSP
jgi:CubicO group peptidase (beta-lactamase class C family)